MVVGDFDLVGVAVFPTKTDAPLLVYTDAELAAAVAFEGFESIGGRSSKVVDVDCFADHGEFEEGALLDVRRKSFGTLFVPDFSSLLVGEAFQHVSKIEYFRFASILF